MKKIIVTIIMLILILLFIISNKALATYNNLVNEQNSLTQNVENVEKVEEKTIYGILDQNEQLLENIQNLSVATPRDPKGGLIMIILIITGAIIIVLVSWWYSTNY